VVPQESVEECRRHSKHVHVDRFLPLAVSNVRQVGAGQQCEPIYATTSLSNRPIQINQLLESRKERKAVEKYKKMKLNLHQ
jgi:hypothetical protein